MGMELKQFEHEVDPEFHLVQSLKRADICSIYHVHLHDVVLMNTNNVKL
jgi:hypothetical protein